MSSNINPTTIAINTAYRIAMNADYRATIALEDALVALHNNDPIAANIAARKAIATTNTTVIAARVATEAAFTNSTKSIRDTFYTSAIHSANAITRPFIISAAASANEACNARDSIMATAQNFGN